MAEIERCRPYFIGLLGERYGWVPDVIHPELTDAQPWLEEHRGKSVTDLEIQHGVLEDPAMDGIAFFYFRDPETSRQVEAELANDPGYQPEPESARSKLEYLKKRIEDSGAPLREDYPDARTLGRWILEDLWAVIDRRFPEDQKPTALERIRMDHEAFAAVRRKVYIGRSEYYEQLNKHAAGDGPPLVLLGESGSGKSALLANWGERYRKQYPDDFLLLHFIGSTADSADYIALLRRIMQEIQERYEARGQREADGVIRDVLSNQAGSDEIPDDPQKVIEDFPLWLARAGARGRFILVLDALNQLEDRYNAPDLGWLPTVFPANVRVILSTLPGRCLEALQKRELETLQIKPIGEAERKQFIHDYLKQYRKGLDQGYADRIAAAPQSSNPLYLRTLLEELRIFGKHEGLQQRIAYYLEVETVDDLFERVLERLEEDYEQEPEHQGLVEKVMSLLWASRRGLSESELLELIELPPAVWSPLHLALGESLISRSGLLGFFHDYLRRAIEGRYLGTAPAREAAHWRLVQYFESRSLDDRSADELPWQLARMKSLEPEIVQDRLASHLERQLIEGKAGCFIEKYMSVNDWYPSMVQLSGLLADTERLMLVCRGLVRFAGGATTSKGSTAIMGIGTGSLATLDILKRRRIIGAKLFAIDRDPQALNNCLVTHKVSLPMEKMRFFGWGGVHHGGADYNRLAAIGVGDQLVRRFRSIGKAVVVCTLGGFTGMGAVPVVAGILVEMGIKVSVVVQLPFGFEGERRSMNAMRCVDSIEKIAGALEVLSADEFVIDKSQPFQEVLALLNQALASRALAYLS
ncbi:MAG: AAA family ATPase [Thiogranum sp.]